ncbi:MFS general substrate transporter [Neoconidiobolus thromboides FSU 785]|nr:MFS general substrate transporter [Neoconidiobolus thromboides FSU 785]
MGKNNEILKVEEAKKRERWYDFIIAKPKPVQNPFSIICSLNKAQALAFTAAFLGWSLDAFDFHLVSFALHDIGQDLGYSDTEMSTGITMTLLLRPVGALIFGLLADRFGRRIPLMIDVILFSVMGLCTGFVTNLTQFIIIRAIFGICMGGEWGLGASLAMESLPAEARGVFSGILQQGYAAGYLLAALVYWAVFPNIGWRPLFYIGSCPALLCIIIRFFVPESEAWKQEKEKQKEKIGGSAKSWIKDVAIVFKKHWLLCIQMILFMTSISFMSHGSQDLFPTYLKAQLDYTPSQVSITVIVQNIGAIIGGILVGWYSEYFGRRRSIALICFIGLFMVPIWGFAGVHSYGIQILGAFLIQFCIQGAFGVVPAFLTESSPPSIRGTFPGLTYQIGAMISASAGQLEAAFSEKFRLENGHPNYALIQSIVLWCALSVTFIIALLCKENSGKEFVAAESEKEMELKDAFDYTVTDKKKDDI